MEKSREKSRKQNPAITKMEQDTIMKSRGLSESKDKTNSTSISAKSDVLPPV